MRSKLSSRSAWPASTADPLDANYRQLGRWRSHAQVRSLPRSKAAIGCRRGAAQSCCTFRPLTLKCQHADHRGLSAWESDRIVLSAGLTWGFNCPLFTVIDPWFPGLMARQWPGVSGPMDRLSG